MKHLVLKRKQSNTLKNIAIEELNKTTEQIHSLKSRDQFSGIQREMLEGYMGKNYFKTTMAIKRLEGYAKELRVIIKEIEGVL